MRRLRDEESAVGLGVVRDGVLPRVQRRSQVRACSSVLSYLARRNNMMGGATHGRTSGLVLQLQTCNACDLRSPPMFRWVESEKNARIFGILLS